MYKQGQANNEGAGVCHGGHTLVVVWIEWDSPRGSPFWCTVIIIILLLFCMWYMYMCSYVLFVYAHNSCHALLSGPYDLLSSIIQCYGLAVMQVGSEL